MSDATARQSTAAHRAPATPRCPVGQRRGTSRAARGAPRGAFSLVELVIVVVIIAIVASIAMRRVSRHAEQAATNGARQDEKTMQSGIERYRAEHGNYPAAANIVDQLTKYTDGSGNVSPTRTPVFNYGPYLRKIPPVPLGPARGSTKIATAPAADVGWIYEEETGDIRANE